MTRAFRTVPSRALLALAIAGAGLAACARLDTAQTPRLLSPAELAALTDAAVVAEPDDRLAARAAALRARAAALRAGG